MLNREAELCSELKQHLGIAALNFAISNLAEHQTRQKNDLNYQQKNVTCSRADAKAL